MTEWKRNKDVISRISQATPAKGQEKGKNSSRKNKKRAKDTKSQFQTM